MRIILLAALGLVLAGCGFHLRGQGEVRLPFRTLYVQGDAHSDFVSELRRDIRSSGTTTLADSPAQAQVVLQVLEEGRRKTILSLSGGGRVKEYNLIYHVSFQLRDAKGTVLISPTDVVLQQAISYSDTEVLAKESEEALLYRNMQEDAVRQVMRRLRAAKVDQRAP